MKHEFAYEEAQRHLKQAETVPADDAATAPA